ncbi:CRISPR-associated helicase Cas3' [Oryzibacter oryziterrae]|uniref:CRISPR-associated helicase Cas3' n=1 Tax=Oryzibacter oryziterrae TaxID=2766474 RepID=UPI001F01A439|nr:CRISPR-associated helicase Cas3' [Oryzibacter oryziterrae]
MLHAHSSSNPDKSDWQSLQDHSLAVASLAMRFGSVMGLSPAGWLAGLLHDIGKYDPAFQKRLEGSKEQVEHSIAGATLVLLKVLAPRDRVIAELIAHAIAGHHAGLPDRSGDPSSLDERVVNCDLAKLDPQWLEDLRPEFADIGQSGPMKGAKAHLGFRLAFLGRMIFSCLVDADYKDTEAYYNKIEGKVADRAWKSLTDLLPALTAVLDRDLAAKAAEGGDGPVNRLRQRVLDHVRRQAGEASGLFTLTVPTGGGKTLTSLAFALDHARAHGKTRIIYAIPFTSVIDQTAGIFKDLFGEEVALEHHSAIDDEKIRNRSSRDKLKLAMEDWAAPIVVTTTVQLFESLFSARPSRCRKLHNIANSVIILDEAQTLPRSLLIPILRAIEELAANYCCTVVLCTATQPAVAARENFPGLPGPIRELAPDPAGLATELKRTRLDFAGTMDNGALVDSLRPLEQALVIVNSRAHALDLYKAAREADLQGVIHLTTRQYAADRKRILDDVRARLKDGRPCRLVATSLVEAGVDVDFPRVFRAEAGLDQISQAAGRCNREGRRDAETSFVTVFKPEGYTTPREIAGLIGDFERIRGKHSDLFQPAAIEEYFSEVFWRLGTQGLDAQKILPKLQFDLATGRSDFAYRTVGEAFRMIESGLLPVIVQGDDTARKAVEDLFNSDIPSGVLARRLQTYVVQVPPKARAELMAAGHVVLKAEKERGDQFAVLVNGDLYHSETGLIWEDGPSLSADQTFI